MKKAVSLHCTIGFYTMTPTTIQTDNSHFTKAIVQLCKALGIAKAATQKTAAPKTLRTDIAAHIDGVQSGTAILHSFETREDLQNALMLKTGQKIWAWN
jgi:hypothetical protein